ncbi:acyl-CoA dehydrogenase family protein [Fibrobacter sp. UWB2]|nr:acyl-CoA dehydrogenase family protein [Fibrobacter sp. UWB2]
MNSEYANQNSYDCIQVHGGSGYMLEYACQRLYRDARITSIYEGTTQLQTVAALPHITTGSYGLMLEELEAMDVRPEYESLKARAKAMDEKYNEAIEYVKSVENNEFTDLCSRHLYELAANCVMTQLLLRDATKAPELFDKSMKVYLNLAEAEVAKHYNFVKSLRVESLESYKQA